MIFFAKERPAYVWDHLASFFDLNPPVALTIDALDTAAGTVTVNTVQVDVPSWSGQYFAELPVTVTAVPKEGYVFSGWSGGSEATEAVLQLDLSTLEEGATLTLTPVFTAAN